MHLGLFPELTAMTSVTVGVNWVNLHLQYLVVGLPLHSARQNVTWIGGTRKLQLLSTQFNQKPNRALCAHFLLFSKYVSFVFVEGFPKRTYDKHFERVPGQKLQTDE